MRLLILGGTAWLGGEIALAAVREGHEVVCGARAAGRTPAQAVPAGARLVRVDRNNKDGLAELATQAWDAVIDVSMQPGQVRQAVRDLRAGAKHYVLVSTVSVYAEADAAGADESAALLQPLEGERMESLSEYGEAKVACEQAVLEAFGSLHCTIVRPGLIGGPGDPSGRTSYWPRRLQCEAKRGGVALIPEAAKMPVAVLDVRDLAQWLVFLAARQREGVFNALGEAVTFEHHLDIAAAGGQATLAAASPQWLLEQGVGQWSGPRSLPIWIADPDAWTISTRSSARALAAGLRRRPLTQTLTDGAQAADADAEIAGESARALGEGGPGLTDAEQDALLAELRG